MTSSQNINEADSILFINDYKTDVETAAWQYAFSRHLPDYKFECWPSETTLGNFKYALVWQSNFDRYKELTNLRGLFSFGAGIDHLVPIRHKLQHIPVIRMVEYGLTNAMVEYALYYVLHFHRDFHLYSRQQLDKVWQVHPQQVAVQRSIGVMGLGVIGSAIANQLVQLGFIVNAWSRSEKSEKDVRCFHGESGLYEMAQASEIIICVLPLTRETEGILNKKLFAEIASPGFLIHMGRGQQLVADDLLAALAEGELSAAAIDVFTDEPLPSDHAFWQHEKIAVTPHIAGQTHPDSAVVSIKEQIRCIDNGLSPLHVVDWQQGY